MTRKNETSMRHSAWWRKQVVHDNRKRRQGGAVLGEGSRWCMTKERDTSRRRSAWWRKQVVHDKKKRRQGGKAHGEGSSWCITKERDVKEAQCLMKEAGGA